jgi:hypothetical protein
MHSTQSIIVTSVESQQAKYLLCVLSRLLVNVRKHLGSQRDRIDRSNRCICPARVAQQRYLVVDKLLRLLILGVFMGDRYRLADISCFSLVRGGPLDLDFRDLGVSVVISTSLANNT